MNQITKFRHAAALAVVLACLWPSPGRAASEEGYLQFPAHNGRTLVFAAEGDLWSVPLAGGTASRLTSGEGDELHPRFSPDGEWIAFSASYEGSSDVYVMPAGGGSPTRLTFTSGRDDVIGWTADGRSVLYSTRGGPGNRQLHLFQVPVAGGVPTRVPVGTASLISFHADGRTVAFNRTGRFYATWKRYGGGTSEDLWMGDIATGTFRQVTTFHGADVFPMWSGDRLYFASDRDGWMNIWSLDRDGGDLRQHTHHRDADVRWPSIFGGTIVYHLFGDVWRFDTMTGASSKVDVRLPSDRRGRFTAYRDAARYVTDVTPSWDGSQLALATRGNVFAMPARRGRVTTISADSGWRVKHPAWSPDGDSIAAWATISGEEQLYLFDPKGKKEPRQLTESDGGFHFAPAWAPDGASIAFADEEFRLRIVNVETGEIVTADQGEVWETREYAWSPDSRYLAYSKAISHQTSQVWVYDTQEAAAFAATDPLYTSWNPLFDPSGDYLFFLSNRTITPTFSQFEFETIANAATKPYFAILRRDGPSWRTPEEMAAIPAIEPEEDDANGANDAAPKPDEDDASDDEDENGDENGAENGEEEEADEEEDVEVVIDAEGLFDRTFEFPVEASNYYGLAAGKGRLFFVEGPTWMLTEDDSLFEEDTSPQNILHAFHYAADDFDKREAEEWIVGMTGYELSGDGKHILYSVGEKHYLAKLNNAIKEHDAKGLVALDRLSLRIDPAKEWAQILHDAYLYQREFFYAPNMGGTDWDAVYGRYRTLLPRLATRAELNDVIGQMIAELGTGHTYVWGGGDVERGGRSVSIGHLGADLAWDAAAGAYRVAKVLRGYAWDGRMSPLAAPHARVEEGALIHAINGQPLVATEDPARHLADMGGRVVELDVSLDGTDETRRTVFVTALRSDAHLRYIDWVEDRRAYVAEETNGEFGYLHVPDMGGAGLVMFFRYFFP